MTDAFTWQTAPAEEHGLDSGRLEEIWSALADRGTKTFLIARNDRILCERYADDWSADKPHYSASLAKAVVGGLSLMLTMDDGLIDPDDRACQYVPQWRDDPVRSKITIRHLATHSSGVENAELSEQDLRQAQAQGNDITTEHMSLPGWKGAFWRQEPDPFTLSRDAVPIIFAPGTQYDYSNPGMAMLAYAVTAALRGTDWPDIRTLLRERIFAPIGLSDDDWSVGYGKTFDIDGLPLVANWGGGGFTARAVASIGRLMLQRGAWDGQQLISPAVVQQAVAHAGTPLPGRFGFEPQPGSGLGWWTNFDRVWPNVPADAFGGAGAGNQILLVVPGRELIIVRNGAALDSDQGFWGGAVDYLFDPVMDAFALRPPCPQSPVIAGVDWDPPGRISRLARGGRKKDGSDNWPMTWADDDHLYTAYGDGYGFEPQLDEKLSLGLCVVTGGPDDFAGFNIRSRTGEFRGPGPQGEKSSGLLMVDGVLYMWIRNADRQGRTSRLGWSTDHARTWAWCDWTLEEFGHPAFVNYGRDYAGARDEHVYIVSHDSPSAYETADRFILMRAPRGELRNREAYEFFRELDGQGRPQWSPRVEDRGPVFTHPNQCRRASISYDAGLRRYLWWQQLTVGAADAPEGGFGGHTDTRFSGGFGLYDAPEPWGPWTTVFFTDQWDVGPGDLGCLPTKWMSWDGKTVHLVFSSEDNFAVRRGVLKVVG